MVELEDKIYHATLSRFSHSIFFDTARAETWHNTQIKQLTMRLLKLLHQT